MKKMTKKRSQNQRRTIGLLCANLTSEFVTQLLVGTADAAQAHDVDLICFPGGVLTTPIRGLQSNILFELAGQRNVDGLIIMSNFLGTLVGHEVLNEELFKRNRSLPAISIGLEMEENPAILVDNYAGMYAAIVHLIEQHGHERIAFICGPQGHPEADIRFQAYQDALSNHNLPLDPSLVAEGTFLTPSGIAATSKLLDEQQGNFQAIVAANDLMALGALETLNERNIRVPYEIAVVGFDDMEGSQYTSPPLTTVRQPVYEIGKQAVETLVAALAGEDVPQEIHMPTELVVRQSCGCINPAVAEAMIGSMTTSNTRKTLSAKQKENVLTTMMAAIPTPMQKELKTDWAEKLLKVFLQALNGDTQKNFLATLDENLRQVMTSDHSITVWGNMISGMRRSMLPLLNAGQLLAAEDQWVPAHVMVSEAAQQQKQRLLSHLERQIQVLNEIQEALITSFDTQQLIETLARELPRLGIPSCYLSLYEDPQNPIDTARLLLAYDKEHEKVELPDEKQVFPSQQLIPEGIISQERLRRMVVMPLYFHQEQIGFILLEMGPREGNVYETLRSEISSTLQGAKLVQRVQERSNALARQQYILDTFMENVPDRIYFKDIESRFTQANKALLTKLGLDSPEEVIGKTDFDFFPGEQSQKKYEEEQEIIHTGKPILNLEELDGIDQWASTTKMPLRDEKGNIIGTFGISRDITELVKAKQVAENAKEEAEQARRKAEAEQKNAEIAKNEAEQARKKAEAEQEKAEAANRSLAAQMWQTKGQAILNECLRGEQEIAELANNVIQNLCEYLDAQSGMLYTLSDEDDLLKLSGTFAYQKTEGVEQFRLGQSAIGQAALGKRTLSIHIPSDISGTPTSAGAIKAQHFLVAPFIYGNQTFGVIEIGTLTELTAAQTEFISNTLESIAIAFMTAQARRKMNELLTQTRQQAEELQTQEEELRATNEELEAQTDSLRASEARLRENQSKLEVANTQLEEKALAQEKQQAKLDLQNQELEQKAEELALASKYKSEFLANMSHELRTPLNSMLILASMLSRNEDGNLTPEQVESATVIHSGGTDLLNLINEILDLTKVEAGKMDFHFAAVNLKQLITNIHTTFEPVAKEKDIEFIVTLDESAPEEFVSDQLRVEQIIKNLLSNAFKFTKDGSVHIHIYRPDANTELPSNINLENMLAISVKDTGIGMTPNQQEIVFEAFQQADGSTSRQYGGTGLGLTITRELTTHLGGQILLESSLGKGSTFTILLPLDKKISKPTARKRTIKTLIDTQDTSSSVTHSQAIPQSLPDDRENIQPDDRTLLIVEDDAKFAKIVYDYAHKKQFKCLLASDGKSALQLAQTYCPAAIILDLNLPIMNGWEVLNVIKDNPDLRHIPIHIMSVSDEGLSAYQHGAMGFLTKPVSQEDLEQSFLKIEQFIATKIKNLLLVEDDESLRKSIKKLLEGSDVTIIEAADGKTAIKQLKSQHFDCMILDLTLPDISGFELLNRMDTDEKVPKCPVIVYTGKELSEEENLELLRYADSVIVKGVKSPERLLDETALFLHRVVADMSDENQRTIRELYDHEALLASKEILIVDDDARNAFALSRLLAERGIKAHIASSGEKAIEFLDGKASIDLVLTDIMMPEMDGYELTKIIRSSPRFKKIPIIALTAKAMKGDREKCIKAGANDYISKPIDPDRLFSMLRVWLSKE